MMTLWQRFTHRLAQFRLAQTGVAAVEFAALLPFMLILYIGANEASALIAMDRRVQMVAGTLGDLVARANGTVTADQMKEYLSAAGGLMTPYPTTGLRQYVTQVRVNAAGTAATVVWAKQYVNGVYSTNTGRPVNSTYPLDQSMRTAAANGYVIVSQATTSYLPFYGIILNQPVTLYRENYYLPRFGDAISTP